MGARAMAARRCPGIGPPLLYPTFPHIRTTGFLRRFHSQRVKGARPGCTERRVILIDATGGHDWRHGSQKTVVTGEPCGLGRDFHLR